MASPAASANGSGGLDVAEVPQAHDAATVNNVGSVHQPMVHDVSDPHLTQASTVEVRSSSPTGPDNSQNNVQHHSQSALVPDATQAHHPQAPSNASANLKTPKAEIAGVNPSSPVAKPSWGHQLRNSFSNWWTWELLSVLISLLCFVGVIILLAVSDGRGVPQLGYRLTLNTIISILITASKSAMLVAVGTAIGQRNWSWMIRDRQRLLDIQIFDDASRGPWGAFTMLLSLRSRDIVALGAVVTILITILDPFAQQLVVYPIRTVTISDESVFVPQATVFREPRGNFSVSISPRPMTYTNGL
ncbi:hypothetical protein H2200_007439 [Cladophialophora chaetospira]|uniref:Uncharacterized protein n=1 Tax=Cladophialophora chaetospira TaxID=386627 RepID=A0AA38X7X4_9EURO|nr:hypothetical protein H2200_007439 [Cladophialophora chaetospira]